MFGSQNNQGLFQNTLTGLCLFSRRKVFTAWYEPKSGEKSSMLFECHLYAECLVGEGGKLSYCHAKVTVLPNSTTGYDLSVRRD